MVECQLAPVIRDFQHIVDIWLYKSVTGFLGSLCERSNHFRLNFARSDLDIAVIDLWHGELQHIGGLNVGYLTEHLHQLWQVVKLGKSCFRAVT